MTRKVISTPMMTFMRMTLSAWSLWPEIGREQRYPIGFPRRWHGGCENGSDLMRPMTAGVCFENAL
jgi:hypothetical protein